MHWREVFILYLFPLLHGNMESNHQNKPIASAWTVCHSSPYIILYVFEFHCNIKIDKEWFCHVETQTILNNICFLFPIVVWVRNDDITNTKLAVIGKKLQYELLHV